MHALPATSAPPRTNIVTFSLGDTRFGVRVDHVVEIVRAARLTRVPGAPDALAGVLDYRGRIIPALDLRARFGIPGSSAPAPENARAVITHVPGGGAHGPCALLVDAVHDIVEIDCAVASEPVPLPRPLQDGALLPVHAAADGAVLLIDVPALMSSVHPASAGARA